VELNFARAVIAVLTWLAISVDLVDVREFP
jgi:hypothetical protein